MLLAARRCGVQCVDHTTGQRRQEAPGQQAQVRFIDPRADGTPLIKTEISDTWPCGAVVAKHRYRVTDLVQRFQQVAPCRVQTLVHFVMAVFPALGKHAGGLGAVDVEVALPACNGDGEGQSAHARANP
ncbi:hypothetical protein D3C77_583380 [compost metagenome]